MEDFKEKLLEAYGETVSRVAACTPLPDNDPCRIRNQNVDISKNEDSDIEKFSFEDRHKAALAENRELRNKSLRHYILSRLFSGCAVFVLVFLWLGFVGRITYSVIIGKCLEIPPQSVEAIINTLLISSTAQVLGLLIIVLHYLFPQKPNGRKS